MKRWLALVTVLALLFTVVPGMAESNDHSNGSSRDNSMDSSSGMDNPSDDSSPGKDNSSDDSSGMADGSSDSSRNERSYQGSDNAMGMDDSMNRTGIDDSVNKSREGTDNSGDDQRFLTNATALENEIHRMEQEHAQNMETSPSDIRDILEHQQSVQVGVDSFLLVRDQMGTGAPDITSLVRQFNDSLQSTTHAEEQIRNRDSLTRFFIGGDDGAAQTIDIQVTRNQDRIRQLNQVLDQCTTCSPGVKAILQQQIQTMEQEQARLSGIVQKEHSDSGLFGWLFP